MVLVVSPLIVVVEDHVKILQSMGVAAAYTGQDPDRDDKIAAGKYFTV